MTRDFTQTGKKEPTANVQEQSKPGGREGLIKQVAPKIRPGETQHTSCGGQQALWASPGLIWDKPSFNARLLRQTLVSGSHSPLNATQRPLGEVEARQKGLEGAVRAGLSLPVHLLLHLPGSKLPGICPDYRTSFPEVLDPRKSN